MQNRKKIICTNFCLNRMYFLLRYKPNTVVKNVINLHQKLKEKILGIRYFSQR